MLNEMLFVFRCAPPPTASDWSAREGVVDLHPGDRGFRPRGVAENA